MDYLKISYYLKVGKILPYEDELIENLRGKTYNGLPLEIFLQSYYLCRKNCYICAIALSRAMNQFNLMIGNINQYPIDKENPNHSWIEKDGWVYDTTFGLKFKKEVYYSIFDAKVLSSYDENNIIEYDLYKQQFQYFNKETSNSRMVSELTFKMLEYIEKLYPSMNGDKLLNEIKRYREDHPYTDEIPKEIEDEYMKNNIPNCLEGIKYY